MDFNLNSEQLLRYDRNILIKEIGMQGQKKLLQSRVLVIGAGGLGSASLLYLASSGVGTIGIADSDDVEISNLQRQIIHFTSDVNKPKTESSRAKIAALNPDVKINTYKIKAHAGNISDIIKQYDFILDCTDNFKAKFLINDACFFESKPFSHAGVLSLEGQTMTVIPKQTCCYRCIFGFSPPKESVNTSLQVGILGAVAGHFGTIQAIEAIKFLTNTGELLTNKLLTINAKTFEYRMINLHKNVNCPLCGKNPCIKNLIDEK